MADIDPVDPVSDVKGGKRKGKQGRYKTISGILKSVTGLSQFRHKTGEPIRSRSFEKIQAISDQEEEPHKNDSSKIERKDVSNIKQREFTRRHSEFSISTSTRPRQPSMAIKELDENKRRLSYTKAKKKLYELLETEIRYVEIELQQIVDGYYTYIEELRSENSADLPDDFLYGCDLIVFANIKEIYEFHKSTFLPELQAAVEDPITLKNLFDMRKDFFKYKYGRYCVNKPQSGEMLIKHLLFFEKVKKERGLERGLDDLMTTPVRRIQMYSLLLKDIAKLMEKAEQYEKAKHINSALQIAAGMANYANDMMIVGHIKGFHGDVNKYGLLLRRGIIECADKPVAGSKGLKYKKCHVFLFQESIVICTEEESKSKDANNANNFPNLAYWHHFPMNKLLIAEISDENNTFEMKNDLSDPRNEEEEEEEEEDNDEEVKEKENCIIFKCEDEDSRNAWYREFNMHKSYLSSFADALSNPGM